MSDQVLAATKETPATGRSALRALVGLALLAPAGLAFVLFLIVPTISTFVTSLQEFSLFGASRFIGLRNYAALFHDAKFLGALGLTSLSILVRTLLVAMIPLLLALAVNEFGRGVRLGARLLFTIPLAMFAPVASALAWRNFAFRAHIGLAGARTAFLLIDAIQALPIACGIGLILYLAAMRGADEGKSGWKAISTPLLASWGAVILATIALTLQAFSLSHLLRLAPGPIAITLAQFQFERAFLFLQFGRGAAVASLTMAMLIALGLAAGLIIVQSGLRLDMRPAQSAPARFGKSPGGKALAALVLVPILLFTIGASLLHLLPAARVLADAFAHGTWTNLGTAIPIGRTLFNTILPALLGVLLVQVPLAYAGALGIGALRPFGKRSELLLLPFSPWLFVTIGPLSLASYMKLRQLGMINSFFGLFPPILLSVPMLFILTLFFKGQEPKWRQARAEGQPVFGAFLAKVVLPSLPLTALLGCASFLVAMQELLWPLLTIMHRGLYNLNLRLTELTMGYPIAWPVQAAAIIVFGVPLLIFFLAVLIVFQAFYLERLALAGRRSGTE